MMKFDNNYNLLNRYCSEIIFNNEELFNIFVAKKTSPMYYLWYETDMKYDYHIDTNPIGGVNAHYSVTCFLNDPSEYYGGELVLKVGDRELEYKLEKGKAVIYPTGMWHKVNKVTSGDRKVLVFWVESAVKNSFIRNHLIEYGKFINSIDANSDIIEGLEQFRINLMREYADF